MEHVAMIRKESAPGHGRQDAPGHGTMLGVTRCDSV